MLHDKPEKSEDIISFELKLKKKNFPPLLPRRQAQAKNYNRPTPA